jgi:hypothetical protein
LSLPKGAANARTPRASLRCERPQPHLGYGRFLTDSASQKVVRGSKAHMLQGVPVALGSAAAGAVHSADPHRQSLTLQAAPLVVHISRGADNVASVIEQGVFNLGRRLASGAISPGCWRLISREFRGMRSESPSASLSRKSCPNPLISLYVPVIMSYRRRPDPQWRLRRQAMGRAL